MLARLKTKLALVKLHFDFARAVTKAERSLHVPYFLAVAWHYGPLEFGLGGVATALVVVSVLGLFVGGGEA